MRGHGKRAGPGPRAGAPSCANGTSEGALVSAGAGVPTTGEEARLDGKAPYNRTFSVILHGQFSGNITRGRWEPEQFTCPASWGRETQPLGAPPMWRFKYISRLWWASLIFIHPVFGWTHQQPTISDLHCLLSQFVYFYFMMTFPVLQK